ncbi:MAG: TetR/AcrR family transcriptional regulator [Myxococcota bacterium]
MSIEASARDVREIRKAEQMRQVREQILTAAGNVFLRDGYQQATMRGIATEAGYTASALYNYFPSKEALFRALRESMTQLARGVFEMPLPRNLSFAQKLAVVVMRFREMSREMRESTLLFVATDTQLPDETFQERLDKVHEFYDSVCQWVADEADEDELVGHNPGDIAYSFVGLLECHVRRALADGTYVEQRMEAAFDIVLDHIYRILGAS